jgi:hypothetical protein
VAAAFDEGLAGGDWDESDSAVGLEVKFSKLAGDAGADVGDEADLRAADANGGDFADEALLADGGHADFDVVGGGSLDEQRGAAADVGGEDFEGTGEVAELAAEVAAGVEAAEFFDLDGEIGDGDFEAVDFLTGLIEIAGGASLVFVAVEAEA